MGLNLEYVCYNVKESNVFGVDPHDTRVTRLRKREVRLETIGLFAQGCRSRRRRLVNNRQCDGEMGREQEAFQPNCVMCKGLCTIDVRGGTLGDKHVFFYVHG
jgi:hypothetical protein